MIQEFNMRLHLIKCESKVLQYFGGKCGTIQTALNTFAEVVKKMNHTELWDAELAWYSLSATHWIYLYGSEFGLRNPRF